MSRRIIPLKTRVRYEGKAKTFDRRPTVGADLEKLPNPIWRTVGLVLRSKLTSSTQTINEKKSPKDGQ